ncbi:DUF3558 family protein [Corynebacterium auris]|uniref:DUF3558 family protein n=1 Tax=Corynebacterium auris TaxID=44750 RepID=UPI0025B5AA2A|nr:DUF3558 family protein [Corynebacterium auris]WJY67697.1 hypothetical protein CAURIS_03905 [Corynebacterium auris]
MRIIRGATPCVVAVCVATTLAACNSPQAQQPANEAAPVEEVPAFHFQSGDLVLGDYDPYTIGENLFNPCAEITDEEFAAAGFVGKDDLGYDPIAQKSACMFETEDRDVHVGFMTNAANREISAAQARFIEGIDAGDIPGVYFYQPQVDSGVCFAVVDTERGAFSAVANSFFADADVIPLCERASRSLQALYNL